MISTVIVTYNEADSLKNCLRSIVDESDEIVVVDLGSSDETLKVAASFKAKIINHKKVEYVEKVRDFAISKATGEWVLVLDPDEKLTAVLWKRLKEVVVEDKYDVVNIPRKNIFFDKWISHTNWWPDKQLRFFKKGNVSWLDKIHLYPKVEGRILELPSKKELAIEHFGYKTLNDFISRQSRYSTIESQNLYQQGERFSWKNLLWKPIREFLVRYIKHLGFLDGFYGFCLTYLMMIYQLQVMVKLWELERQK